MNSLVKSYIFKIILLFLIWRIGLFAVAAIASQVLPANFGKSFPYYEERLIATGLPHFIWAFGNFDGVHYLGIAKDGYAYQFTQVFFPLYPLLIRFVSLITFGNLIIAGLLVSNLAFLGAILLFYRLISENFDEKVGRWSVIFLLVFPTSYYFGAIYTEGLFFAITISFFYLLEKQKFWQAAIIGLFASATRLVGVFLGASILTKRQLKLAIVSLISSLGLVSYIVYLKIKFNSPLYFLTAQQIFGQERSTSEIVLLPQVLYRYIKILTTTTGQAWVNAAFELTSTIFAILMLILAYKKVKPEWLTFSFLAIIIPTLTGTLISMPRYILVAFPIFVILGLIKSNLAKSLIVVIFLAGLIIATAFFTQGYWIA